MSSDISSSTLCTCECHHQLINTHVSWGLTATERKNFTSPIHNAGSVYVNSTLTVCLWVMLTSSPAAVALGLLHFLFLAISCFARVPSDWTCGTSTSLCFLSFFYSLKNPFAFECPWISFVLLCFLANLVASCFLQSRGTCQSVGILISVILLGKCCFSPSHSRCCAGIESSSGMGHLLSAGFHLLCWQVLPVYLNQLCEMRAEASLHMVPARLDPRPNLTPLQNTQSHTLCPILFLVGRRNAIYWPRGRKPAGQCLCRAPFCSGLDNVQQWAWSS